MAPGGRSKGKGRMESIEEDIQGPHTPEFTGEEDTGHLVIPPKYGYILNPVWLIG
jgi:hypothetical protein